jgi:predicted TIM-barrel fold metal-dependent hydrolase
MIIDAHTHIGRKYVIGNAKKLVASMDKAGIDVSLVFAGMMNDCPTERLLREIKPYGKRLRAVGAIAPLMPEGPTVDQAERWLAEDKVIALKFYVGYEHYFPYDDCVRPYLELCVKYGRPAIFHSGDLYNKVPGARLKYAAPLTFDDLAVDLPDLRIVIAHLGSPWPVDAAEVVTKNANVWSDCSGFVYGEFDEEKLAGFRHLVGEFLRVAESREKILFGSDWPICDQASYVAAVRTVFGDEAKDILCDNARRLFGIGV